MSTINASAGGSLAAQLSKLQQQLSNLSSLLEVKPAPGAPLPPPDHGYPLPTPMPMPEPDYFNPPIGKPPIGYPIPTKKPTNMWHLEGRSIRDIAKGIVAMYDQDGDGRVSAQEAVRVQRQHAKYDGWYGYGGPRAQDLAASPATADLKPGMEMQVHPDAYPRHFAPFGGTQVDVYSMTQLLFSADRNHNGKVGVAELARHLRTFDKGDNWSQPPTSKNHKAPKTAGDGKLTGSEFAAFMTRSGEHHIGSWTEPGYRYYPPFHDYGVPVPLGERDDIVPPAIKPMDMEKYHAGSAQATPAAADDSGD